MSRHGVPVRLMIAAVGILLSAVLSVSAQDKGGRARRNKEPVPLAEADNTGSFIVRSGYRHEIEIVPEAPDSVILTTFPQKIDSLRREAVALTGMDTDSLARFLETAARMPEADSAATDSPAPLSPASDSVLTATARAILRSTDSLSSRYTAALRRDSTATARLELLAADTLSAREKRRAADTLKNQPRAQLTMKSGVVRDSLPLSRMTLYSLALPGFSQIYEGSYVKAAVGIAAVAAPIILSIGPSGKYKDAKAQYEDLISHGAPRSEIDPVHTDMIHHNTTRQLLWAGAAISYMALLADGVSNYPSEMAGVKKATTLSMLLPGSGQFYNRSFWRIPFVVGAFATMGYLIDWNNRGYKRFDLAYDLVSDGDDSTVDEFNGRYSASYLKNLKDMYRRNRDLAIIGTAGVYLLNVIDAHVDAHLKDFDISDDITMNVSPQLRSYGSVSGGLTNTLGLNLNLTF